MRRTRPTALACLVVLGGCWAAPCSPRIHRRPARRQLAPLAAPPVPLAPPAPSPPPATSTFASEMVMEANGWRLPVTHAIATSHGGEALTVWLSNAPLSCESARRDSFATPRGQEMLRLRLARLVTRTRGDERFRLDAWSVRSVHAFQSLASDGTGAPSVVATVSGDFAVEGRTGRLVVDYDAPDRHIRVRGSTAVTGCGLAQVTRVVPRPQPRLSLGIGDETLTVLGATWKPSGLHLSTAPLDCGVIIPDRDVDLLVSIRPGGGPRTVFAGGDRVPPLRAGLDADGLSVVPTGPTEAPTIGLALSGVLGPELERPIRVSGVVEALRCAER